MAYAGGTIYIGGNFTRVGPAVGGGVPLDATSGAPPSSFPKVTGYIDAVVSDGVGGWFIGGGFATVGGLPRNNLAHVAADLSVTPWNPGANSSVSALAASGSTLYVAGDFTMIGGLARSGLAALEAATGAATDWNPGPPDDYVHSLAASSSAVYVAGRFASIGGQLRSCIAAIDAATGAVTAWNPNATGGDLPDNPHPSVYAVAVSGSTIYAGGWFSGIGGQPRNFIAALDGESGLATAWNPNADFWVHALAVQGSTIYAGGMFGSIGGFPRSGIAALNASTGQATLWNPNAQGYGAPIPYTQVLDLQVSGSTVYVAGSFSSVGGQARNCIAALNTTTGAATAWNPDASGPVGSLAVSGSSVYAGGSFTTFGGKVRNHIAALDAATGVATNWDPNANNDVVALAVSGSTVYAGGYFTTIAGQSRNCIAALSATTGAATSWNPNATLGASYWRPRVMALAVSGSTVYAGGDFATIGGQPRSNLAALDAVTGTARAWNPSPDNRIYSLALSGSTVYVGGHFGTIGGQGRGHIAALDAATGQATGWNPSAGHEVHALAVSGSTVFAGSGTALVALDAVSGAPRAGWNPNPNGPVLALAVSGAYVYAGGTFTSIGGQARNRIAALDATTGSAVSGWNPNAASPTYGIWSLAVDGPTIYMGGEFNSIGGRPQSNIAGVGDVTTPTLLSLMSARALPDRVDLAWHAPARDIVSAAVQRRTSHAGWAPVGTTWPDGTGRLDFRDTQVTAGTRYGYRLGVMEAGQEVYLGETWVDVPLAAELALALRSNPSPHDVTVAFTLPDASPARLELFDMAGRRLAAREVGSLGAGDHALSLGSGARLPPGTYVLRLSQRDRSIHARGVILR